MVIDLNPLELESLIRAMRERRVKVIKTDENFAKKWGDDYKPRPDILRNVNLLIAKLEKFQMDQMPKGMEAMDGIA